MKRPGVVLAVICFVSLALALLVWFGTLFRNHLDPGERLTVVAPEPQRLSLTTPVVLDLQGSGFDRDTSVSLVMDVSNHDMVIHHYPLEGFFNTSLIAEDLLFLGSNEGLMVVSLADQDAPRLLKTYLQGRPVIDLHYADGYLFAACGRLGLVVMSLEQDKLSVEAEIWTGDTTTLSHFHQGYLYVSGHSNGLQVYDLSNPDQIKQIGRMQLDKAIRSLAFYGDLLYLSDRSDQLYLYDCSNPTDLREIDRLKFVTPVRSILVKGPTMYVSSGESLQLFSLTDPKRPDPIISWNDFSSIGRVVGGKDHVYVVDRHTGLRIVDVRDHSITEQKEFAAGLQTIVEGQAYLYVTGSLGGLMIVDKLRLRSRQVAKWISPVISANDVIVAEDTFYLANFVGMAQVDKNNGAVTAIPFVSRRSGSLARYQEFLFAAQADAGIKILDVSHHPEPQLAADWPGLFANRLLVVGDYLVVSYHPSGVQLIDLADISSPHILDQLDSPHILSMATEGDYVFCMTYGSGMLTYRVHLSGRLELISRFAPPFPAQHFDQQVDIDVRDGTAYIANGRSGLLLVNVKNPAQPQLISTVALPGYSKGVRFHDNLVYVVSLRHGISVVDVSSAVRPRLAGVLPLSRLSKFLLIDDDLLYFFQDSSGMAAIPLPQFAEKIRIRSGRKLSATLPAPNYPGRYNLQISNRRGMVTHNAVVEFY